MRPPTPELRASARRATAILVVALVAVALVAGCGITDDSKPRALPPGAMHLIDSDAASTTAATGSQARQVKLYFLTDDHLTPTVSSLTGEPSAEAVLQILLKGPSAQQLKQGITSSIPSSVELISARTDANDVLQVNLGPQIGLVGGNGAKAAYAQMVFTAAGLGHAQVQFSIDGKPIEAPTDEGNQSIVTVNDYKPPLNPT